MYSIYDNNESKMFTSLTLYFSKFLERVPLCPSFTTSTQNLGPFSQGLEYQKWWYETTTENVKKLFNSAIK